MAESLGDALLTLRTDDRAFTGGVARAERQAEELGLALDRTRDRSQQLGQGLAAAGGAAVAAGGQFSSAAQGVTRSANAQRAGMQQLSMQLNDVATMYALGARPMQIFASQGGQVIQAVQLMTGGTSRLAGFLAGPWGLALTTAAIVLVPLIGNLLSADDASEDLAKALDNVKLASDGAADAQSILGRAFDLNTGKLKNLTAATMAQVRAEASLALTKAKIAKVEAEQSLRTAAARKVGTGKVVSTSIFAPEGATFREELKPTVSAAAAQRALSGRPEDVIASQKQLEADLAAGRTTVPRFIEVLEAGSNLVAANAQVDTFGQVLQSLDSGVLAPGFRTPPRPDRANGNTGGRTPPEDRTAQNEARFQDELGQLRTRLLAEEARYTENIKQRRDAELAAADEELAAFGRQLALRDDLTDTQKQQLLASKQALAEQQKNAAEQEFGRALAEQENALLESSLQALADDAALRAETAVSSRDRKEAELELFDLNERLKIARLDLILATEATASRAWQQASEERDQLERSRAARRDLVAARNASPLESFIADIEKTAASLDDEMEKVAARGLDSLNQGLVDVIMNAKSLGQVFKSVADQIIADLLRIAIQQAIIGPLANALFGGGRGPINLLSATSLFAGKKALGGLIPDGQFGIVGEAGPEPVIGTSKGAMVLPNSSLRGGLGGRTSVTVPISIDATGADPAGLERVRAQLDQLQQSLPGLIVNTVQDAGDRRLLQLGGGR